MIHVAILGITINLIIGTWAAVYVYQINKSYTYPFIHPIFSYTVSYNLLVFCLLIWLYLNINLPENYMQDHFPYYKDTGHLFMSLIMIWMAVSMVRIYLGFRDRQFSGRTSRWIWAVIVVLILSYGFKWILKGQNVPINPVAYLQNFIWNNIIILEIPPLILMLIDSKRCRDRGRIKVIKYFACLYLLRYVSLAIPLPFIFLFEPPRFIKLLMAACIFISFNTLPFIWFKFSFLAYAQSMLKHVEDKEVLEEIFRKFRISRREQEILKLVVDGRSNQEIADSLFIALHTVKNHVYSLYQKLGIKNRYQLIHLLTNYQKQSM